jgi:hypothetical protein
VTTRYLPGLEDVPAPPGIAGRDLVLWRLARFPAKRLIMQALFSIAGGRGECSPTAAQIRERISEFGQHPPTEANVRLHLRELDTKFHVVSRAPNRRARSRRRLLFEPGKVVDHRPPRAPIIDQVGSRSSTTKGADHRLPPITQVQAIQAHAQPPVSPLNSIQNSEEEKTLTLGAPLEHRGDNAPPRIRACEIMARLQRTAVEVDASPPPPRPSPPPQAPHVETVDRIRRLADPCGPEAVEAAAGQAARMLGDERSIGYYRSVFDRVRTGELPAKVAVNAFRQARSPTASRPGAVFAAFVKEHAPPRAKKPISGASRQTSPEIGQESPISPRDPSQYKYTREAIS